METQDISVEIMAKNAAKHIKGVCDNYAFTPHTIFELSKFMEIFTSIPKEKCVDFIIKAGKEIAMATAMAMATATATATATAGK